MVSPDIGGVESFSPNLSHLWQRLQKTRCRKVRIIEEHLLAFFEGRHSVYLRGLHYGMLITS